MARWGTSTVAPGTLYSTYITPRSIAYGLFGKPKTHQRANTQSVVPETSSLHHLVPPFSSRIPSIWRICHQTGRAQFEISSIQRQDHFVMNMCSFFYLLDRGQIDIFVGSHSVCNYELCVHSVCNYELCVCVFVRPQMQQKGFRVEAAWMFRRIHLLILDNPSRRRKIRKLNYKHGKYLDMNYLNLQQQNHSGIHPNNIR